jgi:hypothetical protein
MNRLVFRISEYIIRDGIKDINMNYIIENHKEQMLTYLPINYINSFEFNTRIFKKLVLYKYCFHYKIEGLSDKEVELINYYIHNTNTKFTILAEENMLKFLAWCKQYNSNNKIIYITNRNGKFLTFR